MSPCNINPWYNSSFSGEASPSHASTSHQMSPLRKMMKKFRYNNIRTWSISPHAIPFLCIQTTWTIVQNNTTKLFFDLPSAIFYFLLLLILGTTKKKEHRNSRLSRANKKEAADVCNTKERDRANGFAWHEHTQQDTRNPLHKKKRRKILVKRGEKSLREFSPSNTLCMRL